MRVTQSMILRNTLRRVNYNRDEMNLIQNRISSQKRIEKASDDPLGFNRAARFRSALRRNNQYLKNISDAQAWTNTSSISLNQMHDYAMKSIEYAMQALDGAVDSDMRKTLADSIRGLLQDSVSQANSQYMGKAIFAGTKTSEGRPFLLENDTVTYQGNDESINRRLSKNIVQQINVTGKKIMDTGYFEALSNLISALDNNDQDEISAQIDNLKTAEKNLLTLSASLGSTQSSLELMYNRTTSDSLDLKKYISDEEDANMEEEIVKFKSEQTAYQAALQSANEVMNMNILNYMGSF